jgi:pimeloyl-ACP methyl ester carboxylesterase
MNYTSIPTKKRGIIILLHGNSSSPKVFKDISSSYSLIIPTLPGHEISSNKQVIGDLSLKFYKKKLLELIHNLKEPIFLVGNSLGGHLAIEIAREVSLLKGLMIFGAPPVKKPINFEEAFLPVEALQTFLSENPTSKEIEAAIDVAVQNDSVKPEIVNYFKDTTSKVRLATLNDIMDKKWSDQYEIFTNLSCKKMIVAPEQDPSVNFEYLKTIACNSDNINLEQIMNCGHYPTLEKPTEMSKLIEDMAVEIFNN